MHHLTQTYEFNFYKPTPKWQQIYHDLLRWLNHIKSTNLLQARWFRYPISVGERFPASAQTVPGAHPASYKMGTSSFLGIKQPVCVLDHPSPSSTKVEERVELYLYSPSGRMWPVPGWIYLYFILLQFSKINGTCNK